MDFAVIEQPEMHSMGGIIGEFYNEHAKVVDTNSKNEEGLETYRINIKHHSALVTPHVREGPLPGAGAHFECWEATPEDLDDLFPKQHKAYKAKILAKQPDH